MYALSLRLLGELQYSYIRTSIAHVKVSAAVNLTKS